MHSKIAGTLLEKGSTHTDIKCEYFGVRFMPGINPSAGVVKLSELVNNEECFEDMITSPVEREELIVGMYHAKTFEEKITVFMNYYSRHYDTALENKNTLNYALRKEILTSGGNLKLSDLSTFTGYTERYLNKKIHEHFGMSPKHLIRYIRFQKSVSNLVNSIHNVNSLDTAMESGYFDQSHFIKEFKQFSGLTPKGYIDNLLLNSYDKKLHIIM